MNRKNFFKKGLLALTGMTFFSSCDNRPPFDTEPWDGSGPCPVSPHETKGPFPIKTPAQLVKENIVMDRKGIPLLITLTIQSQDNECYPLSGVNVDLWHCDADGNYSEYGDIQMQKTDYTSQHFLRGRQMTDANGQVSFISIFPGWYRGRAPHIHVEVLDQNGASLNVTQIAFEENLCNEVYATTHYHGPADQKNETDNVFSNSLEGNMADSVTGDLTNGYTLLKTIIV